MSVQQWIREHGLAIQDIHLEIGRLIREAYEAGDRQITTQNHIIEEQHQDISRLVWKIEELEEEVSRLKEKYEREEKTIESVRE